MLEPSFYEPGIFSFQLLTGRQWKKCFFKLLLSVIQFWYKTICSSGSSNTQVRTGEIHVNIFSVKIETSEITKFIFDIVYIENYGHSY